MEANFCQENKNTYMKCKYVIVTNLNSQDESKL